MKIAYFGLGKMGLGPALNLRKSGYEVHTAVHESSSGPEALKEAGGVVDASAADAVRNADFIITIVPNDAALKELILNVEFLDAVKPGAVLIEMTSCSADAVIAVADALKKSGADVLDAPVSGGTKAANAGTMTMMCAGSSTVLEKTMPLLKIMGEKIFHVGEKVGDGKKIKSLNNLLGAMNKAAAGEVWRIAEQNQLDPDAVLRVIAASSGDSAGFRQTWPKLESGDFRASFTVDHMRKDVDLALGLAAGLTVPLAEMTGRYYEKAAENFGQEDSSAAAKIIMKEEN